MLQGPAYQIETERLVLRGFEPRDAEGLRDLVDRNVAHLRPWLDWARDEPRSFEDTLLLVRRFRAKLDLGEECTYAIVTADDERLHGACSLRTRPRRAVGELGYWLDSRVLGRGYCTEAVAGLARVAFEVHGLERLEIHCDADNERSAAVARRLGFALDARLRERKLRADGTRVDRLLHSLLAREFPESLAAQARCVARDAIGRVILDARAPDPPRRGSAFR